MLREEHIWWLMEKMQNKALHIDREPGGGIFFNFCSAPNFSFNRVRIVPPASDT